RPPPPPPSPSTTLFRSHDLIIPAQYRIRQILHKSFLYSSAFAVEPSRDTDENLTSITLRGAGWGHGAGLCQIGAVAPAGAAQGEDRKSTRLNSRHVAIS